MKCVLHQDVAEFAKRAGSLLLAEEARHCLWLGILDRFVGAPGSEAELDSARAARRLPWLATVEHAGQVRVASLHVGEPFPLLISRASAPELEALIDSLCVAQYEFTSAYGDEPTLALFDELWCQRRQCRLGSERRQRIHSLSQVESTPPCPGSLRVASTADLDQVVAWQHAFAEELELPLPSTLRERLLGTLREGHCFLWARDEKSVATASVAGATPRGIRINAVYTPPELRGQGYATALVAAVSQRQLDTGREFCFLYTDLDNPTSNRIYARIGYQPVCDVRQAIYVAQEG